MRGAAMLVGLVVITPIGFAGAIPAVSYPVLVLAGVDVGICSSVIPYVCDQLAAFALLPASARLIGVVSCWARSRT